MPRSKLNAIIIPRLEETLEILRDRLRQNASATPGTPPSTR